MFRREECWRAFCFVTGTCVLMLLAVFPATAIRAQDSAPAPLSAWADMDGAAANNSNLAVFPWGDPQYTDGGTNIYPQPSWVIAAWMQGGLWITNDNWYGWQPSLGEWQPELATNRLFIQIDRTLVASNLWIAVSGTGEADATLLAGFCDNDLQAVSHPVVLHVLAMSNAEWSDTVPWFTNRLDFSGMPSASVISLSTTNGIMRIFNSVLCPQADSVQEAAFTPVTAPSGDLSPSTTLTPNQSVMSANGSNTVFQTTSASVFAQQSFGTALIARIGPHTWYVDKVAGNDSLYDGTAETPVPSTTAGPKRTVAAAQAGAVCGDTISVAAGVYPEHVRLEGIRMITKGRVVLQ